jgi:hypothetical protein
VRDIERRLYVLEQHRTKTYRKATVVQATDEDDRDQLIASMLATGALAASYALVWAMHR